MILAKLANIDPGGKILNRPFHSLSTIFLAWQPQTSAPIEVRFQTVDQILERFPDVGWRLVLSLLPTQYGTTSGTQKPVWRSWIPSDWDSHVLTTDWQTQVDHYIASAIRLAKGKADRVKLLIGHIENLHSDGLNDFLEYLVTEGAINFSGSELGEIWEELMEVVRTHKRHAKAKWALPGEVVERIERTANAIKTDDPLQDSKLLFSDSDIKLLEDDEDYVNGIEKLEEKRTAIILMLYKEAGLSRILQILKEVQSPGKVGFTLGSLNSIQDDEKIIPLLQEPVSSSMQRFAQGFVLARFHAGGWPWVRDLRPQSWQRELQVAFLCLLPFGQATWDFASEILGDRALDYWRLTGIHGRLTEPKDAQTAVTKFLEAQRFSTAMASIGHALFAKFQLDPDLLFMAFEGLLANPDQLKQVDRHDLQEAFAFLQMASNVDQERLCKIEWAFLPMLDRISGASPVALDRAMATDPNFFCEILSLAFRSEFDTGVERKEATEVERRNATNAWSLLHHWNWIPGTSDDGSLDELRLIDWLATVKGSTMKSGRFKVAQSVIGQVFARAPKGEGITWIPGAIARSLEASDGESMFNGFSVGLFNLRGVHSWTRGRAELAMAESYVTLAKEFEFQFPRLAATLRATAKEYRADGSYQANRDPFES